MGRISEAFGILAWWIKVCLVVTATFVYLTITGRWWRNVS